MNSIIDKYHLIGNPIKHSISPLIHNFLAKKYNQNISYTSITVKDDEISDIFSELKLNRNVLGLSVTVPFKEKVFSLVDNHDNESLISKTVSNVIFNSDRVSMGLNLDGIALVNDFKRKSLTIENKDLLLIGAGGAANGILNSIINQNPSSITITNRTKAKAINLANKFSKIYAINIVDFDKIIDSYDIVINASSASIDNNMLPIKTTNFNRSAIGYDLMYNKNGTIFTQWCCQNKITNFDGLGMLIELSCNIFYKWRNIYPSTNEIYNLIGITT